METKTQRCELTSPRLHRETRLLLFRSILFLKVLLEHSCFTMLYQFLPNNKVNQLYIYLYPLVFRFLSLLGRHTILSRVPYAIHQVLISYPFYTCVCVLCSVVLDSLRSHGLQPARLLCLWNFPGKNTGVGCHSLHQEIFLIQG